MQKRIAKKEAEIQREKAEFHSQSLHTRTVYYEDLKEIGTYGFRVDDEVCNHVDMIEALEKQLQQRKDKLKHFERYLNTLHEKDKNVLYSYFVLEEDISLSKELEEQTSAEIDEIETAIRYKYRGIKEQEIEPPLVVETGDKEEEFKQTLETLGVLE